MCHKPEASAAAPAPAAEGIWLSALFPAYNEAACIVQVIEEADAALRNAGFSYEIVVLDDASTDRTWQLLQQLSERMPALRLLQHEVNRGIRVSLDDLFSSARGTWLFHNGSDGQWKTAEVLRMMPLANDPHTIVVGRRRHKHYGWWRSFVSTMYNWLPLFLFGVRVYDAGGIKLFPKQLLKEVSPRSRSVFREGERLIRAARAGYRIAVIDVDSAPRLTGKASGARFALVVGAVRDLVSCWWRMVVCRER
jgi:glycosyltransferase involved in cell wall biosynthesis